MNKEDWISTGIKLFGIYLLVMAIISIPSFLSETWVYFSTQESCSSVSSMTDNDSWKNALKQACTGNTARALKSFISVVLYLLFAFYFILNGKLANQILGLNSNSKCNT